MNLQQFEYIVAVDNQRHFARAAGKSFVTQPTLSMMIHKLEEELGVKIFDRSRQPVVPTRDGEEIIKHARSILKQVNEMKDYANELKGEISGELRLGIIPTLAPYLLPYFLTSFHKKNPRLRIFVREIITDDIMLSLQTGELDIGLLATPVNDPMTEEIPLFYEEFMVYASKGEKLPQKKYMLPKQIDIDHLWLLEEGHCLRNQVFNLCGLKKHSGGSLHYEAGSIETLINLVDRNEGITIIPRLAELNLRTAQKKNIREFANPKPVREISLLVRKDFPRKKILAHLKEEILAAIPREMLEQRNRKVTLVR
jgi:LysR family transcriptional regulator, hydrogen peroxide-inducible genes activator